MNRKGNICVREITFSFEPITRLTCFIQKFLKIVLFEGDIYTSLSVGLFQLVRQSFAPKKLFFIAVHKSLFPPFLMLMGSKSESQRTERYCLWTDMPVI